MATRAIVKSQTPSEAVVQRAGDIETIDAGDRKITLKKPGPLAQYRIVEALGEVAKNSMYMSMVMPLLWVTHIDGAAIAPFLSKLELEAFIQRLGEEGIAAIMDHLSKVVANAPSVESIKK
jgi:hypothetical protein